VRGAACVLVVQFVKEVDGVVAVLHHAEPGGQREQCPPGSIIRSVFASSLSPSTRWIHARLTGLLALTFKDTRVPRSPESRVGVLQFLGVLACVVREVVAPPDGGDRRLFDDLHVEHARLGAADLQMYWSGTRTSRRRAEGLAASSLCMRMCAGLPPSNW